MAIKSALLTTGSGPIVNSAYKSLRKYSDLRAIIFSKKKKAASRWKKFCEYGTWYSLQYFMSRVLNLVSGNMDIRRLLPPEIEVRIWKSKKNQDNLGKWLKNLNVYLILVCDFPHILPKEFFSKFKFCINIHPSLLPMYRGPNPIIWGLLDKSYAFGITLHLIDEGIDTGDIICKREIKKPLLPLSIMVEMKLAKVLPELIKRTIEQIQSANLHTEKQEGGFYVSFPTLLNRRIRKRKVAERYH